MLIDWFLLSLLVGLFLRRISKRHSYVALNSFWYFFLFALVASPVAALLFLLTWNNYHYNFFKHFILIFSIILAISSYGVLRINYLNYSDENFGIVGPFYIMLFGISIIIYSLITERYQDLKEELLKLEKIIKNIEAGKEEKNLSFYKERNIIIESIDNFIPNLLYQFLLFIIILSSILYYTKFGVIPILKNELFFNLFTSWVKL